MTQLTVGHNEVNELTCSFCGGTGRDPFGIMSWISTCCVCGGKGMVSIHGPYAKCAHCQGTGAIKTYVCTTCMGKGFVPLPSQPITTCPECHGSGDDHSNPSMACLKCRGKGFVLHIQK